MTQAHLTSGTFQPFPPAQVLCIPHMAAEASCTVMGQRVTQAASTLTKTSGTPLHTTLDTAAGTPLQPVAVHRFSAAPCAPALPPARIRRPAIAPRLRKASRNVAVFA